MEIDWKDNSQVNRALGAGVLPPGYSTNAAGALVVPDCEKSRARVSLLIIAYYDEVVTASGKILKSRGCA